MKFKSLYCKAACAALAFALATPLSSCSGDGDGNKTPTFADENTEGSAEEAEAEVLEHMKMSVEDFATGQKQFALRSGRAVGAIYATGSATIVSDKKADNIWGEFATRDATVPVNMMYEMESISSNAQLRISFTQVADARLSSVFAALNVLEEDVGEFIENNNGVTEYKYTITITFDPIGQTYSANSAIISENGSTAYTWRSSGIYYVEPRGTSLLGD